VSAFFVSRHLHPPFMILIQARLNRRLHTFLYSGSQTGPWFATAGITVAVYGGRQGVFNKPFGRSF